MCLTEVYTDEDMNRIVEELPEVAPGVVKLTKAVAVATGGQKFLNYYWGPVVVTPTKTIYVAGINIAKREKIRTIPFLPIDDKEYFVGFHYFADPPDLYSIGWMPQGTERNEIIICLVKKEWITAVGKDSNFGLTFVTSQAFFPTYPETEARLEDFLAWLKENDPEYAENQLCEMAVK